MRIKYLLFTICIIIVQYVKADEETNHMVECCYEVLEKLDTIVEKENVIIKKISTTKSLVSTRDTIVSIINLTDSKTTDESESSFWAIFWTIAGAGLGSIVGALISLYVYKKGERSDRQMRKESAIDFGEAVYTLSKSVVNLMKQQETALDEYIKDVDKESYKAHIFKRVSLNKLVRMKSFDINKVMKAFKCNGLDNNDFINFYSDVDYLYEINNAFQIDYDEVITKHITPDSNKFLKLRKLILDDICAYIKELRNQGKTNTHIYKYLNGVVIKYYNIPKDLTLPDLYYDYNVLIKDVIANLLIKFSCDNINNIIMNNLQAAKYLYVGIVNANIYFKRDVELKKDDFGKVVKSLDVITQKLGQYYNKSLNE